MPMKTAAHLIAEARDRIEHLSPSAVAAELEGGDVLLVDLREAEERAQHGGIPGAIHAPRGMLEFYADPTSAYYHDAFDPERRTILYCTSGGRSALAADMLRLLGYTRVAHLDGGLKAWREGGPTTPATRDPDLCRPHVSKSIDGLDIENGPETPIGSEQAAVAIGDVGCVSSGIATPSGIRGLHAD